MGGKSCNGHETSEIERLVEHAQKTYGQFYGLQLNELNDERRREGKRAVRFLSDLDEADLWEIGAYNMDYGLRMRWAPKGYKVVGEGAYRVAVALCEEHVLKINPSTRTNHNLREKQIWRAAPKKLREMLAPIVKAHKGESPVWLLMARAKRVSGFSELSALALKRYGMMKRIIFDLHEDNLGHYQRRLVVVDYGHPRKSLERILADAKRVLG